ncbi:unnamed protein product, partial [Polarella glacialis]
PLGPGASGQAAHGQSTLDRLAYCKCASEYRDFLEVNDRLAQGDYLGQPAQELRRGKRRGASIKRSQLSAYSVPAFRIPEVHSGQRGRAAGAQMMMGGRSSPSHGGIDRCASLPALRY